MHSIFHLHLVRCYLPIYARIFSVLFAALIALTLNSSYASLCCPRILETVLEGDGGMVFLSPDGFDDDFHSCLATKKVRLPRFQK